MSTEKQHVSGELTERLRLHGLYVTSVAEHTTFLRADLTGANLQRMVLAGADLRGARMSGCSFTAAGRCVRA